MSLLTGPARRASRKLLERVVSQSHLLVPTTDADYRVVPQVEFIRVLDCEEKICEFNQEACRVNAYNGKKSLIRSFPVSSVCHQNVSFQYLTVAMCCVCIRVKSG